MNTTKNTPSPANPLTIGQLAKASGVGVETIRYYQSRHLLPIPQTQTGYRMYDEKLVGRIAFIKRSQQLGFSLHEVADLLALQDGTDRATIRRIAGTRLKEINRRIDELQRIQAVLTHTLQACSHTDWEQPCPIIETLSQNPSDKKHLH